MPGGGPTARVLGFTVIARAEIAPGIAQEVMHEIAAAA
jgi:hypothetical protein